MMYWWTTRGTGHLADYHPLMMELQRYHTLFGHWACHFWYEIHLFSASIWVNFVMIWSNLSSFSHLRMPSFIHSHLLLYALISLILYSNGGYSIRSHSLHMQYLPPNLQQISITSVIGHYLGFTKSSSSSSDNMLCNCPFHKDDTPSFGITESKGLYHCFG